MIDGIFHILLVEDNPADTYLFRKALESAHLDFELTVIADGAEALAFLRHHEQHESSTIPDLAVLDLNLPKADGAEVLIAIRNGIRLARVPVVIFSSSVSPRDRARMTRLGVTRYLSKPTDLDDFLRIGLALKEVLLRS